MSPRIKNTHFFSLLTKHVQARSIGRKQNFKRRSIHERKRRAGTLVCFHWTMQCRPQRNRHNKHNRERPAYPAQACSELLRGRSHSFGSSTVTTRSAATFSSVCSRPLGQ